MGDGLTHGVGFNIYPIREFTLLAGQRSDVLLDEGTNHLLIKVAHKVEGVVGGIGGALLENLECAVIVHVVNIIGMEGLVAPVVVAKDVVNRVAEYLLGVELLILE